MKYTKIFMAFLTLFAAFSCSNDDGGNSNTAPQIEWTTEGHIVGEWTLTSWSGESDSAPRVYVVFHENGDFDMYQQAFSVLWYHYNGTYRLSEDNILTGEYSDGTSWSGSYIVSFGYEDKGLSMVKAEQTHLRLVSEKNNNESSIYDVTTVPDEVLEESKSPNNVRSVVLDRFL